MKLRHVVAVLAAAGALLVACAEPAFAAGPPVPAGCTFDQSTGVLSCTTTTAPATSTLGPFNADHVPASTAFGGVTGTQLCDSVFDGGDPTWVSLYNVTITETAYATTTAERHGLNGKVFSARPRPRHP